MAQAQSDSKYSIRASSILQDTEAFEKALSGAAETVWWNAFLNLLEVKRVQLINNRLSGVYDENRKEELRVDGELRFVNFILNLGTKGKSLLEQKEREERSNAK